MPVWGTFFFLGVVSAKVKANYAPIVLFQYSGILSLFPIDMVSFMYHAFHV